MTLVREKDYNEVFDSQAHFRSLLDSMARPGKTNTLRSSLIEPPQGLGISAAYVCFALLNRDARYYCSDGSNEIENYLRVNTGCTPVELEEADFILVKGTELPDMVELAKDGILTYPETGATFVIEVDRVSSSEIAPSLKLRLSGPGIDVERIIWVSGWQSAWVQALAEKNSEFPLGVDTILCFKGHGGEARICCLPRSTKIEIL